MITGHWHSLVHLSEASLTTTKRSQESCSITQDFARLSQACVIAADWQFAWRTCAFVDITLIDGGEYLWARVNCFVLCSQQIYFKNKSSETTISHYATTCCGAMKRSFEKKNLCSSTWGMIHHNCQCVRRGEEEKRVNSMFMTNEK